MDDRISRVVIVGGGSAGWLSAGVIAAENRIDAEAQPPFEVLSIESPDVPAIGVGEGTWPSMRATLERIGLSETDFVRECDASFKPFLKLCVATFLVFNGFIMIAAFQSYVIIYYVFDVELGGDQTAQAIRLMRLCDAFIPAIASAIAIWAIASCSITEEKAREVRTRLEARRGVV